MDKKALEMKIREIYKAICGRVDERYFTPLLEDAQDHIAWNRLHAISYSYGCDRDYVALIDQSCRAATRNLLGDTC